MRPLEITIERTPHARLNPNDRGHVFARQGNGPSRAEAARLIRRTAKLAAISQLNLRPWPIHPGRLSLELEVFWERGRHEHRPMPDEDNLIASCKALIDGLAEGLGIDDKRFKIAGVEQAIDPDGAGYVLARLTPLEEMNP